MRILNLGRINKAENLLRQKGEEYSFIESFKFRKLRDYNEKVKFAIFNPLKFIKKYYKKISRQFYKRELSVLVVVNHYYGNNNFNGKSSTQKAEVRKKIVERIISELKTLPNVDIKVCGIKGKALVNIDIDFSHISDPSFLVYESIEWMASQVDKYDYFINIEDDILLTRETFESIVEFDESNTINECFHPNRIEYDENDKYCVDFKAWPGWKDISKTYNGHELRVANNPHSGVAILSKEKILYALKNVNLERRDKIIGYYMASAYANLHEPFLMFRAYDDIFMHKVIHLDNFDNWIKQ